MEASSTTWERLKGTSLIWGPPLLLLIVAVGDRLLPLEGAYEAIAVQLETESVPVCVYFSRSSSGKEGPKETRGYILVPDSLARFSGAVVTEISSPFANISSIISTGIL